MGFKLKFSKIKRGLKHFMSSKAARKKLGLTGKSRHFRQLKRSLDLRQLRPSFSSSQPVSASSVGYQYSGKTLSQLTGGV